MFVLSMKTNKKKTLAVLAAALVVVTAAAVIVRAHAAAPTAECAGKKYTLTADTNEARVAFFKQFGWQTGTEPVSVQDVSIPQKFNDVYTNYNNIQQEQGLDLTPYAGKVCRQYVYEITNYPQQDTMRGTLLVYGGRVVGGDLSTPALDGFMTGFDGQMDSADYSLSEPTLARETDGTLILSPGPDSTAPAEEANPSASSQVPANAWPTD